MEKRTIMEPVVRSPRWAAIEAAVEKVMARRSTVVRPASPKKAASVKSAATRGKTSSAKSE
jgi:hypothetical protein